MTELSLSSPASLAPARAAPAGPGAFTAAAMAVVIASALLAGWAPVAFSVVTVFLFAGPHNWIEARYFLARMPARWGPLRRYFTLGIGGVLALSAAFVLLALGGRRFAWGEGQWATASAAWNSALLLWIATLVWMRGRQGPRPRDWAWAFPVALALIALVWLAPMPWDLALVYAHPLVALAFLQREVRRRRPQWLGAYYACLAAIPVLLALLWWRLWDAPPLAGQDMLTMRITHHAGAGILAGVSPALLVASHTFLEMIHYGVWLAAIPLVGMASARPWNVQGIPLARRSGAFKALVAILIAAGAVVVLGLWAGFLVDYPLTRDVYFTVAIAHVLAEVPFLLRAL